MCNSNDLKTIEDAVDMGPRGSWLSGVLGNNCQKERRILLKKNVNELKDSRLVVWAHSCVVRCVSSTASCCSHVSSWDIPKGKKWRVSRLSWPQCCKVRLTRSALFFSVLHWNIMWSLDSNMPTHPVSDHLDSNCKGTHWTQTETTLTMSSRFLQLLLFFSRADTDRRLEVFPRHCLDPLLPLSFLILQICLDSLLSSSNISCSFSRGPKCSLADVRQPVPTYRFSVTYAQTRPTRCSFACLGFSLSLVSQSLD